MYQFPFLDAESRESVSTKCNECKTQTEQVYIKVIPMVADLEAADVDVMELLKKAKRLVMCTKCGNFRLIN